jgi:hypothetical protein
MKQWVSKYMGWKDHNGPVPPPQTSIAKAVSVTAAASADLQRLRQLWSQYSVSRDEQVSVIYVYRRVLERERES